MPLSVSTVRICGSVEQGLDQVAQEVSGRARRGLCMELGEGKLGGPIDSDEEIQAALRRFALRRCRCGRSQSDRL